jgi:arylsulfatase A-like enzyme
VVLIERSKGARMTTGFRLSCLVSLVCALLASPIGLVELKAPEQTRPNVLFIAIDDMNDWVTHLGGHPQSKTPNLDRLARRGVTFTNAYCAAPACNPSRAALLTGLRPSTTGVYHNSHPWREILPKVVTLPGYFKDHGYYLAGYGKIYHGKFPDPSDWDYWHGSPGTDEGNLLNDGGVDGIRFGALDSDDSSMRDFRHANLVIEQLKRRHEKPFFLALGLHKPHMAFSVPKKWFDKFPLAQITLPDVIEDDLADVPKAGIAMAKPERDHAAIIRSGRWSEAVQAYLATIAFADAQVGRVLDALERSDYAKNTIICLWSDHGWHLGEKEHWRKFALWEEATKAPMIFVVPGVTKAGGRCSWPVDYMNIYPTLTDICGLPDVKQLEGVSMRPLLGEPEAEWKRPALTTHGKDNHAVRSKKWRYIRYADGSEELYTHDSDPMEWKNLAEDPQFADIKSEHASWLPKVNVPDPLSKK